MVILWLSMAGGLTRQKHLQIVKKLLKKVIRSIKEKIIFCKKEKKIGKKAWFLISNIL